MTRLGEAGEFGTLARLIRERIEHPGVIVGPGDDAAVLRPSPGMDLVATTDALVEGRHYLPDWITPAELGARLAAANLSDLAAMAAQPRWALLSIAARADHEVEALESLERGLERTLADAGRFPEALADLDAALGLSPGDSEVWREHGGIALKAASSLVA